MEILAFLAVLSNVILLAWGLGFFRPSAPKQKSQFKSKPQSQLPPKNPEVQAQDTTISIPSLPGTKVQNKIILNSSRKTAPEQPLIYEKLRTRSTKNKHQLNIQCGDRVLHQLRSKKTKVKLTMVLGILRRMNPYTFEELLLTCCQEQGWKIQRNFYSADGGVDGNTVQLRNIALLI